MHAGFWPLLAAIDAWFRRPVEPDAIYACVSLVGTAAALFFTVALLPAQLHYAEGFSVQLLDVLFRHPRLRRASILVFGTVILELTVLFWATTCQVLFVAACGAVIAFAETAGFFAISGAILDPRRHLVPALEARTYRDILRTFQRLTSTPRTLEQRAADLRTAMDQVVATGGEFDKDNPNIEVTESDLRAILGDLALLKQLLNALIQRSDAVSSQAVADAIRRACGRYFRARATYQSFIDPLVIVMARDLSNLLRTARSRRDREVESILLDVLRDLSIASLVTRPLGSTRGYHSLSAPLVDAVKEHAQLALAEGHMEGAFDAAQRLGAVAAAMATSGFSQTAVNHARDLSKLSLAATEKGFAAVALVARQGLAEILFRTLAHRTLAAGMDQPVSALLDAYKSLLDVEAATTAVWMIGLDDPIAKYDPDMLKDRSLSSIARAALFPVVAVEGQELDRVVGMNLRAVEKIIDLVDRYATRKGIAQPFFVDQLYQIFMWLVAFVDAEVTLELLIYYRQITLPSEANLQTAKELIVDILTRHVDWQTAAMKREGSITTYPDKVTVNLLSIWLLLLQRNKGDRLGLRALLDEVANQALASLRMAAKARLDVSATDRFNLLVVCRFLEARRLYPTLRRWLRNATSRLARIDPFDGFDNFEALTHIRRPLVTFDSTLFARWDEEIFGPRGRRDGSGRRRRSMASADAT